MTPIEIAALLRMRPPLSVERMRVFRRAGIVREADLFEGARLLLCELFTPDEIRQQFLEEGRLP